MAECGLIAGPVEVVQQHELLGERMMVRRHVSAELHQ